MTIDEKRDTRADAMVEKMFRPGCFVVLHPDSQVPDAGRVGKIVQREGRQMLVEFFRDELIGRAVYSTIPFGHWLLIGDFLVERYTPRAMKHGWRVHERGLEFFRKMGWHYNDLTKGEA